MAGTTTKLVAKHKYKLYCWKPSYQVLCSKLLLQVLTATVNRLLQIMQEQIQVLVSRLAQMHCQLAQSLPSATMALPSPAILALWATYHLLVVVVPMARQYCKILMAVDSLFTKVIHQPMIIIQISPLRPQPLPFMAGPFSSLGFKVHKAVP